MTKVIEVKTTDLIPDKVNANRHTERGIAMMEASLRKRGFRFAGTLDKNNRIVHGNNRHERATDIGLEDVVVIEADPAKQYYLKFTDLDLTDPDNPARELAYQANRSAQVSIDFEPERVLADLNTGLDMGQFWNEGELNALLAGLDTEQKEDTGPQIDKAAELQKKWGTQTGQVWSLGEHRLAVGDCTDKAVVEAAMRGERADLGVTSPPYFVGKEYEQQKTEIEIVEFINAVSGNLIDIITRNRRIVINCATTPWSHIGGFVDYRLNLDWWQSAFRERGWLTRSIRIWSKHGGLLHNAPNADIVDMHWEYLATFYDPKAKPYRGQNRVGEGWSTSGIWDKIHGEAQKVHSAPFPVIIPGRFIMLYTDERETICDPFLGSGTTLIACEQLKRKCRAIEIDPAYCAVAIQRWVDLTNQEPTLL